MPRVFISAASAEFRPLREKLAAMLLRSGIDVEYEEIFPQTASDTVRKLGHLIKDCPLLIQIVGHHPGSVPEPGAITDLLADIPADRFLIRSPDLRRQLGDFSGITYTQWEAFLALHHGVPFFLYAPADACEPGDKKLKNAFAQKTHLERLLLVRKFPSYCSDDADFVGKILADVHRHFGVIPPAAQPQNLPYTSLGPLFKGRGGFLDDLGRQLGRGGATVIKGRQAIHGMGGVGKTRAAVEFAWAHAEDYTALLFVTADSPEALERNLAALCGPRILDLPEQEARETDVKVAAVLRWLAQNPGWFLILDNADTPGAQRAVAALLAQIPGGHVVITSRLADWPVGVTALELDVLDLDSSIAFLLERTADRRIPRDDDRATAARIAALLDCLALALEQCAAYIRHRRGDLAGYLADWEGRRAQVLAWHDADRSLYPRSLAITYDTSVAQLTPDARELFRMLSWIAPDPMPIWAVEKITSLAEPRALLNEIADLHLARFTADREACTVHRMLQEITRQQQQEEKPPALIAALEWVNGEMPEVVSDVRFWPIAIPLTPHAIAAATFAADRGIADPTARLLNQAALLHSAQANYRAAEPLMRRVVETYEGSVGTHHPYVATALNNLAQLLQATNRLGEAEPLMRRALAIDDASLGDSHPNVARNLSNLAALLQATNRLAEAEPLMRRALAIDEAGFGDSHPDVATDLNNLAQLLQATNRLTEAEPLMRRALAIDEASSGGLHPKVAIDLNNLGRLLQDTNRLAEAEPLMRRALAIFESSLGDSHPNVAALLNNLATLLQDTHRLAEAEPLYRRALAIDEASLGGSHPKVAFRLNNLASLMYATNRLAEAKPLMRRAVKIFEDSLGAEHPNSVGARRSLEVLLAEMAG
jgi:tetratricopeptide (TPR) repeat protein